MGNLKKMPQIESFDEEFNQQGQMDRIAAYRVLKYFFTAHGVKLFLIPDRFIVYWYWYLNLMKH
jgi:hypothetical protein